MRRFFLIFAFLMPLTAAGEWIDRDGRRLPETESMKSAGNFGVQIILTRDDKAFRNAWNTSATPPQLQSANAVSRGGSIAAMIVFHGCAPASTGKCDAIVNFTLILPDGKRMAAGTGSLWADVPHQGKLLLSNAGMTAGFDNTDPPGTYRVVAVVTDKVSRKELQVSAPFTLR